MSHLKTEILAKALRKIASERGWGVWSSLESGANVYNLKKISDGKIKPEYDTWLKLYLAFPEDIPKPEFEKDVVVTQKGNVAGGNISQAVNTTTNNFGNLTGEEEELIELIRKYANRTIMSEFKERLLCIKKALEGQ